MIIDKFDSKALTLMRQEIDSALKSVKDKYGLKKLEITGIRYASDLLSFHTKLEAEVDSSASPEAKQALDDKNTRTSSILGFNVNIVGEKFRNGPHEYEVTSLEPHRPKFPIIAKRVGTETLYKFPAKKTINWLNKEKAIEYNYDF